MDPASEKILSNLIELNTIADSLELLKQRVDSIGNWDLNNTLEKIEYSYNSMLDFMLQNYISKESKKERLKLQTDLLSINDKADRLYRLKNNEDDLYVSTFNKINREKNISTILEKFTIYTQELKALEDSNNSNYNKNNAKTIQKFKEEIEINRIDFFNFIWTSDQWTNSDYEAVNLFLANPKEFSFEISLLISAVTLSLLEYFDIKKINTLFDAYLLAQNNEHRMRSIIGIAIILKLYDKRISNRYPEITERINNYKNDTQFIDDFFFTITQLQYSCITDKITSKMNNDILPNIMQGNKFKNSQSNINFKEGFVQNGENPEWTDINIEVKAEKKINEMKKMCKEGADIYMSSFRHMKNYDFFRPIAHWFYPFDKNIEPLSKYNKMVENTNNKMIKVLLNNAPFCNSDKYSFCMSIIGLGDLAKMSIDAQLDEQVENQDIENAFKNSNSNNPQKLAQETGRHYIFDLYRFFNLYSYNNQFYNPFKKEINVEGKSISAKFIPSECQQYHFLNNYHDKLFNLAEFLMRNEWYNDSDKIYELLYDSNIQSASYYQRRGFCCEKIGNYKQAITYFQKANLYQPNSKWTLYHLADMCLKENCYDTALEPLIQLIESDPNNNKYLFALATAYHKCNKDEEALKYAYKVYYLNAEYNGIKNLIIDCLLSMQNTDKVSEMIMGTDNYEESILSSFIFIKEENYVSAHEMLKIASNQWIKDTQKPKPTFKQEYDRIYERFHYPLNNDIVAMLYDATILR
ncbi:MAG: hypothetical protein K6E54_08450 [Bacteroidaceae bacterium]|nr:hypothetical protein [Bacteroidaceae bacterium]